MIYFLGRRLCSFRSSLAKLRQQIGDIDPGGAGEGMKTGDVTIPQPYWKASGQMAGSEEQLRMIATLTDQWSPQLRQMQRSPRVSGLKAIDVRSRNGASAPSFSSRPPSTAHLEKNFLQGLRPLDPEVRR
jgi:hypothetical protein